MEPCWVRQWYEVLLIVFLSLQATKVFNASVVNPEAVEAILVDLVMATTPSATNPVSQFPRDLDTTNEVMDMTVNYLRMGLESGDPTDLSTVSAWLLAVYND